MLLAHRRSPGLSSPGARDRSRGAVLVEAAIVTPLFFVLVFGIIDIGLAMNDNLAVAHGTRAGARVASASGNDLYADYGILRAVRREASAIPRDQIEHIIIYKPSGPGEPPSATCQNGNDVAGVCNSYTVADFNVPKERFGCRAEETLDKAWCPSTRKVSLSGSGTDYVGVWMQVRHPWVTRLFGSAITLTDSSVIRLEPRVKT